MNDWLVRIDNVTKVFQTSKGGRLSALDSISFEVFLNEFLSVVGPSGCGKTTLLRIIAGLIRPSSGTVSFDGKHISGPFGNVGFVSQNPALFPWRTALGNLLVPAEILGLDRAEFSSKARTLIKLVGLQGFEDRYPFELSGGMQQRISIARALIHDPRLLLMDEPFGSLDGLTRERMGSLLLTVWETSHVAAIFVTHDISEAIFLSDRILVVSPRPGKVTKSIPIQLPRPRSPKDRVRPEFFRCMEEIRGSLDSQALQ